MTTAEVIEKIREGLTGEYSVYSVKFEISVGNIS